MPPVSFQRHRFPPDVIRLAVWLHFRFTLSLRDVEERLAQRGIEVSTATIDIEPDACSTTIARRTRIWSFDDGSASNSASNRSDPPRDFSRLTPPSATTSMFKDT